MKRHFENFCGPIYRRLDELIDSGCLNNTNVILFGINSSSEVIERYLAKSNITVAAYVDNNAKKVEKYKKEKNAMRPDDLPEKYGKDAHILIMSKYAKEMTKQLEELGYPAEQNIHIVLDVKKLEQYVDFSDTKGMREIGVEELRKIQMELLRVTKEICRKHNLRFYLAGGTLLGAIRHKGYIPWDDDIDILMPMKDYKEFAKIINEETKYTFISAYSNKEDFFGFYGRVLCPDTCFKTWDYPYMATIEINIDVFPLYGVPDDKDAAEEFQDQIEALNLQLNAEFISHENLTPKYFEIQQNILDLMDVYPFDQSENITYLLTRHRKKETMPRSIYAGTKMALFEGEEFPVASDCEEYLLRLFGDKYMELPPKEERESAHNYKAFVK